MKMRFVVIMAAMLLVNMTTKGQTYQAMWKQVEDAQRKDLPLTAMLHLKQIQQKAQDGGDYGQLLKSALLHARLQAEIAPDSLRPAVTRLEQQEDGAGSPVLQAVYATVLVKIYEDNHQVADDWAARRQHYYDHATAHPELLAQVKADSYAPFVLTGADSELFGHDLLSVVGMELKAWDWLRRYYEQAGNRQAACLSALKTAETIGQIDTLLTVYGDLPEAGEVALQRYHLMSDDRYTVAQRAAWLQQSMQRWGHWKRANEFRNLWTILTNPMYRAEAPREVMEVGKPQMLRLPQLRHLDQLTMRLFRTKLTGDTNLNPQVEADYKKIKSGMVELKDHERTLTFTGHEVYEVFEDSVELGGLPAGVYLVEFSSKPETAVSRSLYFVSGLRVLSQHMPQDKVRYVVVDATTGQPVGGAKIRQTFRYWDRPEKTKTLTCDQKGEAVCDLEGQRPFSIYAFTSADGYCPPQQSYGRYTYYERQYDSEHVNLFTDRSIYRPGQTVHVAAIVWKEQSPAEQVGVKDKTLRFELRDANSKLVSEKRVVTDRFGKCAVDFTLPSGQLNGRFSVRVNGGSTSFRVEEYKRPTFQVEFPDYQQSYQNGDTVHATAKAMTYAGVPVQGARVHYVVRRQVAYWWMMYSWYWEGGYMGNGLEKAVVNEGDCVTDDDGAFTVDMPMLLPEGLGRHPMFYHFVVEADVTDQAGETHSGSMSLPLGNKPTALTCNLPQKVRSDQQPQVTFSRRNAAGKEIDGTVKYSLDGGDWKTCAANAPSPVLPAMLKSGEHRLQAVCEEDTVNMTFVVFGLDDRYPATNTHDWFYVSHQQFPDDGTPVTLQVGSSDPSLYIVYGIYAGNEVIERGVVRRNAELVNRKFTYQEAYGNGLLITYAWVKDGNCYTHQTTLRRPLPDKKLKLTWQTFRDRLTPGQQEEWRLKIETPAQQDGTVMPADASLMAVLYDKSLDQIVPHRWSFVPYTYLPTPSTGWLWHSWGTLGFHGDQDYKLLTVPSYHYSCFDSSVYPSYWGSVLIRDRRMRALSRAPMATAAVHAQDEVAMANDAAIVAFDVKGKDEAAGEVLQAKEATTADADKESPAVEPEVQVRENLDETAFCYPSLLADSDGSVVLKFTLPESLTTWRFMGIANTPDMLYGSIEGEAVAKKDVMVLPNMPRFIRMGDEAQISARIFNTSDHDVSGQAKLQLLNPEDFTIVYEQAQPFTAEEGKTGSVTFHLSPSALRQSLLICRVTVAGAGFSDGEQHYLPVLPDREYVIKTVSYTQHEAGVKTIDLTELFPQDATQQKLTVEYTNNPVWLMVQSLPVIGQPSEHSALDQAASYYSNLLAKTLLAQSPQVKTVFEQWKRETGDEQTLQSQLQKNQELKELVLTETPWVAAADREAEQKQRLADFFDANGIANRLSSAVEKLQKLQNADGSFSWYSGMPGSIQMTVAVEEMLVRLNKMAGRQHDTRQLQDKAFDYMGREMVKMVELLKKQEKKGHKPSFPSFTALRWLYLCAVDGESVTVDGQKSGGRTLSADVESANDYLIGLLKKDIRRQTIYEKALTAVVLAKHGEGQKAAQYVKSLKEYTVYTDEMGRYYDTRRAAYSWYNYKIPTEVAAIEAIQTVTPDDVKTVDEMRRWLLQEKRTQTWDTPINNVNAVWAFLNGASQTLATTQPLTVLAVDGTPMDAPKPTAGLGYVKAAISEPQGKTFTATKTSDGTSWGAVYAQFFQKTSEVEASQSGISVKREVIAETPQSHLAVGDRIKVRITIESTRDLDFVQVVDRRAACMEPVRQLSGYRNGAYVSPKDYATHYFYYGLAKGKHVIETEYYIDRAGQYETGSCTVQCAYAPEYRATAPSVVLKVKQ